HKEATHADASQRARMAELAIAGEPGLSVDRRELARAVPSYSVETLAHVRAEVGADTPVVWVIGADSLAQLHRWHRWRSLFELAHVLAVGRAGFPLSPDGFAGIDAALAETVQGRLRAPEQLLATACGGLALLPMDPPRPESSTDIRRRIAAGEPWKSLVPPPVADYIVRHRLYAQPDPA
ncbi:nicotinate (nicotinamide) nucleotide adenylyltransferase, partial [Cognatilysobacter lacus]